MQIRLGVFLRVLLIVCVAATHAHSSLMDPPGAPGVPPTWAPALKDAVTTALSPRSPVWVTLAQGILTEVYYPRVDQPQVGDLQFLIADEKSRYFSEQKQNSEYRVSSTPDGATIRVAGQDPSNRYRYEQVIVTDPELPVVRIHTRIFWLDPSLIQPKIYLLFKPAINNEPSKNLGAIGPNFLSATSAGNALNPRRLDPVVARVLVPTGFRQASVGYVGFSDGWQDLSKNFRLSSRAAFAGPGNLALTGELDLDTSGPSTDYEIALAFGPDAQAAQLNAELSLARSFDQVRADFQAGWTQYLDGLKTNAPQIWATPQSPGNLDPLILRSVQVIKSHEDKQLPGAIVASLSIPGIPGPARAQEGNQGGYHLVWPRDLYHAAMGLLAAGDHQTPVAVLDALIATQKLDGSWSQNFWLNSEPYWNGLQMDQVAFPILLAFQLQKRQLTTLDTNRLNAIKKAADFIASRGPWSGQDRWEEIGGYIPSTIAAQIAGLKAAAELLSDLSYLRKAESWTQSLDQWVVAPQGKHGQHYFVRVSTNGSAANTETIDIANGGGKILSSDLLDGGFLELVRLGVLDSQDPRILNTLKPYDTDLEITDRGGLYRRYQKDAYGPKSVGGFWPLLSGERGHYAAAAGDWTKARSQLALMASCATSSGMIPEQIVYGTSPAIPDLGQATPLVWSHAEYLSLARTIADQQVFHSP